MPALLQPVAPESFRFGDFELNCAEGWLRHRGHRLKLQPQPFRVLVYLVRSAPAIVSREELGRAVWGTGVHVDLDQSVGYCIRQIRQALNDSATEPLYLETLPRQGYRFIGLIAASAGPDGAPEEPPDAALAPLPAAIQTAESVPGPVATVWTAPATSPNIAKAVAAAGLLLGAVLMVLGWRHYRTRAESAAIGSVAVLPLENRSGDPNQDYLADGLTDELTTMLARNSSLRVVSRTSATQFKDAHRTLPQIAHALGVDAILEGSVARSGSAVHLTLQLVRAPEDTHVWAESYERTTDDLPALPGEVAEALARRLERSVPPRQRARYVRPEAHDAYVHGRYLWAGHNYEQAKTYFEKAVALQPDYALGWTGIADYYGAAAVVGRLDPLGALPQNVRASRQALMLDDSLAQAHLSMGASLFFGLWDFAGADRELRRAIELDPRLSEAYYVRAMLLGVLNRHQEAIESDRRAMEIEPFGRTYALAKAYDQARQYDAALKEGLERLQSVPNDLRVNSIVSTIYWHRGEFEQAVDYDARAYQLEGDPAAAREEKRIFARDGPRGVTLWELSRIEARARKSYASPTSFADTYAELHDREKTFAWLEEGLRMHDPGLLWIQANPSFDFLHGDPRYRALIEKMGMPATY